MLHSKHVGKQDRWMDGGKKEEEGGGGSQMMVFFRSHGRTEEEERELLQRRRKEENPAGVRNSPNKIENFFETPRFGVQYLNYLSFCDIIIKGIIWEMPY